MTTYLLFHIYDTDGGFGDAIAESKLLGVFATREQAEKVKSALQNPHVYATPYDDLWGCKRRIVEQEVVSDINAFIVCLSSGATTGSRIEFTYCKLCCSASG